MSGTDHPSRVVITGIVVVVVGITVVVVVVGAIVVVVVVGAAVDDVVVVGATVVVVVDTDGVTLIEAEEAGPVPTALVAVTVKV